MELKGSKTEQNLMKAFAGESQARNKYTYFASKARKDGYEQIVAIFEETANNEKEHAKMWFKLLNGGDISSTEENLKAKLLKEKITNGQICMLQWLKKLRKKDLIELHIYSQKLQKLKKKHEARYLALLNNVKEGLVFSRDDERIWKCRNCGHIVIGKYAPEVCPVCNHPKSYFEIKAENY